MDSKTENVTVMDCNTVANGIMRDINDIDSMERMLSSELSSEDLFRIDCAILSSLRNTTDFSRDLLKQLEENNFHAPIVEKNEKVVSKSIDKQLAEIQENAMIDITKPLQNMFDEMTSFVTEAFV